MARYPEEPAFDPLYRRRRIFNVKLKNKKPPYQRRFLVQTNINYRHCEERSDAAISRSFVPSLKIREGRLVPHLTRCGGEL
jgi:hypothetical protein